MSSPLRPIRAICAAALFLSLGSERATAQVPDDWIVLSSFHWPNSTHPGLGGLFLIDPLTGMATAVAGLGADLTGAGATEPTGANSVLIDPSGGALIVGEVGPQGTPIDLHWIQLSGFTVAIDQTVSIGTQTSQFGGGVVQSVLLPDGRALVALFGVSSAPLAVVDLGTGLVTKVSVTLPPGVQNAVNSLCLDPSGTKAWFTADTGNNTAKLCSVPIPVPITAGVTAVLHTTLDALVNNLAYDCIHDRVVATAHLGNLKGHLIEYDPVSGQVTTCSASNYDYMNTLTGHHATGDRLVAARLGIAPTQVVRLDSACAASVISPGLAGGWGCPSGIDIDQVPILPTAYCTASATSIPGCQASIAGSGSASLGNPTAFTISSGAVPGGNNVGICFVGNNGPAALPFGSLGGLLCVQPPVYRSAPKSGGGSQGVCNGDFGFTLQDLIQASPIIVQGAGIFAEIWARDPANPDGFMLSNGLQFTVCH